MTDDDAKLLPTSNFARGSIIRLKAGGPNMLVVRPDSTRTAVITIMGDEAGLLRLFEIDAADAELVLGPGPITSAAHEAMRKWFKPFSADHGRSSTACDDQFLPDPLAGSEG